MSTRTVSLVSGGAGGIGAATCRALSSAGRAVLIGGRRLEACQELADDLRAAGGEAQAVALDVTDPESIRRAVEQGQAAWEAPVLELVANAGIAESAPILPKETSADDVHERHLAVNYHGARRLFEALLPGMLQAGGGQVVQIASSAGLQGYAYVSAYAASKHALLGYTRSAALELKGKNVRLSAVCPHYVDTPLTDASVDKMMAKTGQSEGEIRAFLASQNPGGVLITPEEVAQYVIQLLDGARSGVIVELLGGSQREVDPGFEIEEKAR